MSVSQRGLLYEFTPCGYSLFHSHRRLSRCSNSRFAWLGRLRLFWLSSGRVAWSRTWRRSRQRLRERRLTFRNYRSLIWGGAVSCIFLPWSRFVFRVNLICVCHTVHFPCRVRFSLMTTSRRFGVASSRFAAPWSTSSRSVPTSASSRATRLCSGTSGRWCKPSAGSSTNRVLYVTPLSDDRDSLQ